MMNSADCLTCKVIRTYLILAIPVLAVLFLSRPSPFGSISLPKIVLGCQLFTGFIA